MQIISKVSAQQTQYVQDPLSNQESKVSGISGAESTSNPYQGQKNGHTTVNDTVQIGSNITLRNLDTVKAIEQLHARINDLVKGVRDTNESLNKAAEQVSNMQSKLMVIVKNYPPFTADSTERKDILMSYVGIRKEIERLTFPKPPESVYEKVASMWTSLVTDDSKISSSVLPVLGTGSSDTEVKDAVKLLSKTSKSLAGISDGVTQALLKA